MAEFKERIAVAGATLQSGFGYGAEGSALRRGFPATGGAKRNRHGGGRICQTWLGYPVLCTAILVPAALWLGRKPST